MAIRVTLHCPLSPEKVKTLTHFLTENLPNVRSFDGCLYVNVLFNIEKQEMLLEEQWESIQHHQHYIDHISNNGVMGELMAFFEARPEIKHFEKSSL